VTRLRTVYRERMPASCPATLVSVDIEAVGPNSSDSAMLSSGARLVDVPEQGFSVDPQPDREGSTTR